MMHPEKTIILKLAGQITSSEPTVCKNTVCFLHFALHPSVSRHHPSLSNQRETFILVGTREMNPLNVDFDVVELSSVTFP